MFQIEDQIEANYFDRHWSVFWPSQVAEALHAQLQEVIAAMSRLADDGKLRARLEFYDADGETVWACDKPQNKKIDPTRIPVETEIETFALFFVLADEWRRVLDQKKMRHEKKKRAERK